MENGKRKTENKKRRTYFPFSIFRFPFLAVLLLTAHCSLPTVSAQKRNSLGWVWQNPLPQGNPLYSIHFAKDKEIGYSVGSDGTILRTENGGFRWEKQFPPTEVTLSSVFVKDKKSAVIVGARGTVLLTDNGGKDWKQIPIETKDQLYGVNFAGENFQSGWAVGTYGRILKTSDGGETWKTQDAKTNEHLLKISALDKDRAVIAGLAFFRPEISDNFLGYWLSLPFPRSFLLLFPPSII